MRRYLLPILPLLLILVLTAAAISRDRIPARVVGVTDGDSLTVIKAGNEQVKIRLHGIDCPEGGQDFGNRAKQFTSRLCFGKTITFRPVDIDRYGRTVATVLLEDGKELNLELLKAGYAWHYKRYSDRQDYAAAEENARAGKLGLWADPHATPPWEWRRERRGKKP